MKKLDLLNEFRELISQLRNEVEAASAMQLYDINKISEEVIQKVFGILYGLENLKNLNADKKNFPGIDLADDIKRIAIQVTATPSLEKVKNTLETFIREEMFKSYDRLIIYVLTRKQNSYSQNSIDQLVDNKFSFSVDTDIHDFQELCEQATNVDPKKLLAAINVLKAYLRGVGIGLADEDLDPIDEPNEKVSLNLIQLNFQTEIYLAEIKKDILINKNGKKKRNIRDAIRKFGQDIGVRFPSAYVAHSNRLITFFDLEDNNNPYINIIEPGTSECLASSEFYNIDENYERVFKSLLKFSLQQRLFKEHVVWDHDESLFVFHPRPLDSDIREESWMDKRVSTRKVFERKFNKKDSSKIFYQKHLAFSVDFFRFDENWALAITPSWFFSHGNNFLKSGFADENISWLKRHENNRSVFNHFRFLSAWLHEIDEYDIFSLDNKTKDDFLTFGDIISINGHPALDESLWEKLPDEEDQSDIPETRGLFA